MAVEELIKIVMDELKNLSQSEVYIGKPIPVGETVVIPVSKISMGFGAGGCGSETDKASGRGTGGGILIEPIALLVIRDEETQLLSLKESVSPIGKLAELIPELIAQIKRRWDHSRQERTAEESKESDR